MLSLNIAGMLNFTFLISHLSLFTFACVQIRHTPLSGGYCGGVPPLPIPNREVKPTCADGTAMQCGRVGRRLLSMKSLRFRKISEAFLFSSRGSFSSPLDFFLAEYCFVTQIWLSLWPPISNSQMTQIFSYRLFCPTDFTDLHRFSLVLFSFLYFTDLDLLVWDGFRRFSRTLFTPETVAN